MQNETRHLSGERCEGREHPPLLWPVIVLLLLTVIFFFTDLDFLISDAFYDPAAGFAWQGTTVGRVLHEACPVVVALFALYCLIVLLGSPWLARLRGHRPAAAFLLIALALGPGLIVNVIFKGQFGRPRPFQTDRYDGEYAYQRVLVPSFIDGAESFPSGDVAVAAFVALPAFVLWRRRRRLAWRFLAAGLASWAVVSFSRIAMGAHWGSDVLWSAGFVYLSGYLLYWLFFRDERENPAGGAGGA
jgi:membrane-associated PAP2 superfamily phosphatase